MESNDLPFIANIEEKEKYSNLIDESYIKLIKTATQTALIINSLFFVFYIISFIWGVDYFNFKEDPYISNLFYDMGREFSSSNCENKFPIGISQKPDKYYQKTIIISKDIKICMDNIFSMDFKQALSDENIAKLPPAFNLTCWDRFHFSRQTCPTTDINGVIIDDFIINGQMYFQNKQLVFGYEERLRVKKACSFIDNIKGEYTRFFLPFFFLIIVFSIILVKFFILMCLSTSTKDDRSRPPKSSETYTSREVVAVIETVREYSGRVVDSKNVYGNVQRTRVYYHQIPWTGEDRRLQIFIVLINLLGMGGLLYYYAKQFYVYYNQVLLVVRLGNDKCFENDNINTHFANDYSQGFDLKLLILGLSLLGISLINAIFFAFTFILTWKRISILEIFLLK